MRDLADRFSGTVADTDAKLQLAEAKVAAEDVEVKTALDKASEAQSLSREAYEKVEKALATIRDIDLALQNLDQISKSGNKKKSHRLINFNVSFLTQAYLEYYLLQMKTVWKVFHRR